MADKYPIILVTLYFATATADVLKVFGFQHVNIYINILLVVFYELLTTFTKTISLCKNDFMDNWGCLSGIHILTQQYILDTTLKNSSVSEVFIPDMAHLALFLVFQNTVTETYG